jgi:RimJ/RimL family protein N-acetyltransferase
VPLADELIVLDRFQPTDAAALVAAEDDEQARRFGWFPKRSTLADGETAIARWQEEWRTNGPRRAFATRLRATGELVGGCELRVGEGGTVEVSYFTFPAHRRQRLASRAMHLACEYAFTELDAERLEAHVAPDNIASRGVALNAGFSPLESFVGTDGQTMLRYVRKRSRMRWARAAISE